MARERGECLNRGFSKAVFLRVLSLSQGREEEEVRGGTATVVRGEGLRF